MGSAKGDEIPLPVRIAHVARDTAFQRMLGGDEFAARVVRERAGGAFDPAIAERLADDAAEILALEPGASVWEDVLACEPSPHVTLEGEAIDRALAAMGNFADLASPYLVGHSAGVAALATAAGRQCRLDDADLVTVRRSAFVHDVGRVAVPVRIWQKPAPLTPDEWEQVRLHAYHTERVLSRSPFLAALAPGRHRPPRATRRLGIPPGSDRRRADASGSSARRRGRLPRDDRAADRIASRSRRDRRPKLSARRRAPDGSMPTPSPPCSRRPGSRRRASSGRRG